MSDPSPSWETTKGCVPLEIVRNSIAAVYAPRADLVFVATASLLAGEDVNGVARIDS